MVMTSSRNGRWMSDRGFPSMVVQIEEVGPEVAQVHDLGTRKRMEVRSDIQRAGVPYEAGQVWVIDQSLGQWTFVAIFHYDFPAPVEGEAGSSYRHVQGTASAVWTVNHDLGRFPAVTVTDTDGKEVEGDVVHNSINSLTVTFSAAFSGEANCS